MTFTEEQIREAIARTAIGKNNHREDLADHIIAELTRPQPEFREDELIEQLENYVKRHSKVIDQNYVGVQLAKKAITALKEMQQRIAELEETLTKSIGNCEHWIQKYERLDAALKEISLGVVAPMDFAKKARAGE